MSDVLTYTLTLQDQISAKMKKIGVTSDHALDIFGSLQKQSLSLSKVMGDTGRSVGTLQMKLDLLRRERDWIPAKNLTDIKRYNAEINKLEKQINHLQTTAGGRMSKVTNALSAIPGAELLTNPIVQAGAALFGAGKMAFSFDEGMAKINTTAQMSEPQLKAFRTELINIGVDAKANLSTVPAAYEKILSQTNDVSLSTDILKSSLKGAKAGFTEQETVAAALAQTLSLVGKENTTAQEVIDTLFAAKRVGAGEFVDFANYVPGLIASGQALGKGFKETAGLFAFMTGKGQSAERSAMLIQNAYTALGKSEITKGMEKGGVQVFNPDGSMKQLDVIFGQMQTKLAAFGKNDKAKSAFLESMGLRDAQAKQAFMVMASDAGKLTEAIDATANSQGELEEAFKKSDNPMRKIQGLWSQIQKVGLQLGDIIIPVLTPAFEVLGYAFSLIGKTLQYLVYRFQRLWELLNEGDTATVVITAAIIGIAGAMAIQALWSGVLAVKMALVTAAQWALNIAMSLNPFSISVIAIIALIAAISWVVYKLGGFAKVWEAVTMLFEYGWSAFTNSFKLKWLEIQDSFMSGIELIEKGWYKVKSLWDKDGAKEGLSKLSDESAKRAAEIAATKAKISSDKANAISGFSSLKWQEGKKMGDIVGGLKEKLGIPGITPPAIPGTTPGSGSGDGGAASGGSGSNVTDGISSGGTRNSSVQITFKNMVENIVFDGSLSSKRTDLEAEIMSVMSRVLGMAQASS